MTSLVAIATLALSLCACFGYGAGALRLLRAPAGAQPLRSIYALGVGMGTLAYLILGAGLAGVLTRTVLGALAAAGWALAVVFRRDFAVPKSEPATGADRWLAWAAMGALGMFALMSLVGALRPPDGLDWDSLSYHLAAPKVYLQQARIPLLVYDSHTDFPATMEMLYTLGLAFGGAAGGKLFHWAAGWLTALALWAFTARLEAGGRRVPAWAGPTAAALFVGMPVVLWEMGTAYVDLGTALFQLLALTSLTEALRFESGRPRIDASAAARAGVISGFALGTKYTALLQFGLLGLMLAWACFHAARPARGTAFRALALFGVLGVLVGSPWYVKNWVWVHNPVYPFYYSLFPHSFSWNHSFEAAYANEQKKFGMQPAPAELLKHAAVDLKQGRAAEAVEAVGQVVRDAVLVPWNLAVHGRAYYITARAGIGDRLGSLGPVWVGLLPLLFWSRRLAWQCRLFLGYSLASLAVWFLMSQQVRYLMPVFAPLAVAAAMVLAGLETPLLRRAAGGFVGASLALTAWMHAPLAQSAWIVVTGQVTEAEYLTSSTDTRGVHEASQAVNRLPEGVRVALYQETRGFYMDHPYFWANPGQHDLIPYDRLRNGDELVAALRRFGITHVLINYDGDREGNWDKFSWYRLLRDAMMHGKLVETFHSTGARIEDRGTYLFEIR